MRVLFVCSGGIDRSPTARDLWLKAHPKDEAVAVSVYSAGDSHLKKLIEWSDRIMVMENRHAEEILRLSNKRETKRKLVNFNIPDMYSYGEPELKRLILERFSKFLGNDKKRPVYQ